MAKSSAATNLGLLISGRGSNMDAILAAVTARSGRMAADNDNDCAIIPRVVISSKLDAPGLRIASEKYRVATEVVAPNGLKGWEYDRQVVAALQKHGVDPQSGLVCLAGFMRIISPEFVRMYRMRILNIHPALLPSFPGLHAQRQALEYGAKVSGCTVHFVDEGVDSGPIILQRAVEVRDGDTEETLSERILEQEHLLYPKAVRLFAEGKLRVAGRRVFVQDV